MLNPKLAILDETDSGLDVDAVKTVSRGIQTFQQDDQKSLLIITHNSKILEYLHIDYVHILINGKIIKTGDASLIKSSTNKAMNLLSLDKENKIMNEAEKKTK